MERTWLKRLLWGAGALSAVGVIAIGIFLYSLSPVCGCSKVAPAQAMFEGEYTAASETLTVTHTGGVTFDANTAESIRVYVITDANYSEIDSARKIQEAPLPLGTGDSFQVNDVHANDTVTIVWNSSKGNTTIVDVIYLEDLAGGTTESRIGLTPRYGP